MRSDGLKGLICEHEFLMSEALRAALHTRCYFQHLAIDLFAYFVHARFQAQDSSGINIHVIAHAVVGFGIGANLYDWRKRSADDGAAPGSEKNYVGAAGDQLCDLGVIVDIGKTEAWLAIGHNIQKIQSALPRNITRLDQPRDCRISALAIRADGFLFYRGQPALSISRSEAGMAHDPVVVSRLLDRFLHLLA